MAPRPRIEDGRAAVKTTLLVPAALWTRAKHRAIGERCTLRDLLIEGLEMRLATPFNQNEPTDNGTRQPKQTKHSEAEKTSG